MELNIIKEKSQKSKDQDQNRPDKPLLRFILRTMERTNIAKPME